MLQADPEIQQWRTRLQLLSKALLMLLAFAAAVILVRSFQARTFIFSPILFLPFAIVLLISGRLFGKILWGRRTLLQQLEACVLAGDATLLADQQPVPNAQALPFSAIIEWRTKKSAHTLLIIFIFIVMLTLFLPFLVFIIPDSQLFSVLIQLGGAMLLGSILILIVERYSSWKRKRQFLTMELDEPELPEEEGGGNEQEEIDDKDKIDITTTKGFFALLGMQLIGIDEEGFSAWTFETRSTIPWNEAQLFCIMGGGRGPKSPLIYMLASERACARWIDAPSQSFWPLTWYRPVLPDTEHQQKMQACLQVIAGKTGLSLYDLRGKL